MKPGRAVSITNVSGTAKRRSSEVDAAGHTHSKHSNRPASRSNSLSQRTKPNEVPLPEGQAGPTAPEAPARRNSRIPSSFWTALGKHGDDGAGEQRWGNQWSKDSEEESGPEVPQYALWFIHIDNPLRSTMIKVVKSKIFDRVILLFIILNCITLAMDSKQPCFDQTRLGKILDPVEYVFLAIFTAEMIVKILAMGFVSSKGTYLRDGWNVMDFTVVVLGWLAFSPSFGNYTAIRVVRVFRPLRTITGVEGMRMLVVTLFKSLPMLLDVMILCAFAFFIFGIVGIQLFSGVLQYRCGYPTNLNSANLDNITYTVPQGEENSVCSGKMTDDVVWSAQDGGEIVASGGHAGLGRKCPEGMYCTNYGNPSYGITSFDNILWAWLTIFQCISLEGWSDVMYQVQDASSAWVWIYFTILIVFGSFFAVNLALAVLYLYFTNSHEEGSWEGSEEEGSDVEQLGDGDPFSDELGFHVPVFGRNKISKWCYRCQSNPKFEYVTMGVIVINTVVMASEHHGMPDWQSSMAEYVNIILTVYFTFEMLVKLIGLRWRGYVEDKMNVFDGVVVIASIVEIIIKFVPNINGIGSSLSILRTFRLMRVFKLARSWKELNKIINTIFKSLSSIAYLSLILLLFIFIMALLGMQLFGYKFMFCDAVENSFPHCPKGIDALEHCPSHFDCYMKCGEEEEGTWIDAWGSPYNNRAYCERFPRDNQTDVEYEYLAQVGKSAVSRHNFDNIFWSVITIFQILTGENWNSVMYDGMRSTTRVAAVYFIMIVVVGNYIILNLFLAILLDNFAGVNGDESESGSESDPEVDKEKVGIPTLSETKTTYNSLIGASFHDDDGSSSGEDKSTVANYTPKSLSSWRSLSQVSRMTGADSLSRMQSMKEALEGESLFIFSSSNLLRIRMARIVGHKHFEHAIILLICLSSITLALDAPSLDPDGVMKKTLTLLDTVFVVIFAVEAALKIVVSGFLFNGKYSYLRNPWNILDFAIVVVGVILLFGDDNAELTSLRALRTLRALRPIRVASRNEGMKVVVNALFQSVPPIMNVLLVCLLFFLVFGILGINLFKGRYYSCVDDFGVRLDADYILPDGQDIDKTWCREGNHTVVASHYHSGIGVAIPPYTITHKWENKLVNFDDICMAMLALFEMATLEMWLDVMYDGADAVGVDKQPKYNNNPSVCVFFVFFIIVGSFFVLNLFVGVTIDKFNEMQQKQEGTSLLLTQEQEQWLHIQKLLATTRPCQQYIPPTNSVRRRIFKVVTSKKFDVTVMAMIMINILFMAMQRTDNSKEWEQMLFAANLTFTSFFVIEAVAKLIALGVVTYFKDGWNAFDFCVIIFSIIGILVDVTSDEQVPVVSLLRVFRVARIFRLIPKAKGLRTLFQTLVYSLPALVNVGSVLFLFFFIFAIMGMNLFGTIRHGEFLNRHANFESFPQSLLALFRMATGESWNGIMHDCMKSTECMRLDENATDPLTGTAFVAGHYFSPGDEVLKRLGGTATDQCAPHASAALAYFTVFVVVCAFILLNLVIAVILDNFQSSSQNEEMPVGRGHLLWFTEVWSDLDPHATSYIPTVKLSALISELEPPLGISGTGGGLAEIQNIIMSVDIPNRGNKVHFLETLHALAGRVAGTQLPEDEEQKVHEKMYPRLPDDVEFPKYTAAHFYAALYVQAAVRGFLARHQMKGVIDKFNEEMAAKGLLGPGYGEEEGAAGSSETGKDGEAGPSVWTRVKRFFSWMVEMANRSKGKVGVETNE